RVYILGASLRHLRQRLAGGGFEDGEGLSRRRRLPRAADEKRFGEIMRVEPRVGLRARFGRRAVVHGRIAFKDSHQVSPKITARSASIGAPPLLLTWPPFHCG